jgi:3-phenylpropionate/cinnamic acid dioxygenase small subunit
VIDGREIAEVYNLYARYAHAVDERRFEEWADCLTDDAEFEQPGLPTFVGRAALIKMVEDFAVVLAGAVQRHVQSNILVELDGDRGTGMCNLTHYITRDGTTTLTGVGMYRDELQKVDGHWRFSKRVAFLDHQLQAPSEPA